MHKKATWKKSGMKTKNKVAAIIATDHERVIAMKFLRTSTDSADICLFINELSAYLASKFPGNFFLF